MGKSQEVSNKTLLILIVAVTVVTIVSTWFIVDSVFETKITTGDSVQSAEVTLVIDDGSVSEDHELEEEASVETSGEVSLIVEE